MRPIEIKTNRDVAIGLFPSSYSGDILRVHCRFAGTRRWSRFLLVPDEGEGYKELEAKAPLAAQAYLTGEAVEYPSPIRRCPPRGFGQ